MSLPRLRMFAGPNGSGKSTQRYHRSLDLLMRAIKHSNRTYLFDNSREGGRTPNVYEFLLPAGLPAVYDATTSTGAPTAATPASPGRAEIEALREDDQ